jgi:hypothetical protein
MIEQLVNITAAAVVFALVVIRLNSLHAAMERINAWRAAEVIGLAILMAGCAGVIGEWFLPNADFYAETIVMVGISLAGIGMSRGDIRQFAVKLQNWDGSERRSSCHDTFLDRFDRRA